jgi:hypothetical protein
MKKSLKNTFSGLGQGDDVGQVCTYHLRRRRRRGEEDRERERGGGGGGAERTAPCQAG